MTLPVVKDSIRKRKGSQILKNTSKIIFKDTHREKTPSIETPALAKGMIIDIWVLGTSNQFSIM